MAFNVVGLVNIRSRKNGEEIEYYYSLLGFEPNWLG